MPPSGRVESRSARRGLSAFRVGADGRTKKSVKGGEAMNQVKTTIGLAAAAAMALWFGGRAAMADTALHIMSWEAEQVDGTPWWDEITKGFAMTHPGVKSETNFGSCNQYLTTLAAMTAG